MMVCLADEPAHFLAKHSATPAKPFSSPSEALRKRTPVTNDRCQTTGFYNVGVHPQLNLPRNSQDLPVGHGKLGGKVMTEVVIATLAPLSVGVFLAHAFDAYRTGAVGTRYPRY